MLRVPSGWKQHLGEHLSTLYPPEGGGRIRCHERLRPLMSMSTVVARLLATDIPFAVERIAPAQRLVTDEGEYAGWTRVEGMCEGVPARRFIGAVFADEFVTAIDCLALVSARFAELEAQSHQLLEAVALGLGQRARRFLYQPPPGWQPLPSGLVTTWMPPGFPADVAKIVVHPAKPTATAASPASVAQALEASGAFIEEQTPFQAEAGLAGTYFRTSGPRRHRDLVVLDAAPYRYELHLEATGERVATHRATFAALARSAQPLPSAGRRGVDAAISSALWAD